MTISCLKMESNFSSSCIFSADTDFFRGSKEKLWLMVTLVEIVLYGLAVMGTMFCTQKHTQLVEVQHIDLLTWTLDHQDINVVMS